MALPESQRIELLKLLGCECTLFNVYYPENHLSQVTVSRIFTNLNNMAQRRTCLEVASRMF